jgi:hypothetical protein
MTTPLIGNFSIFDSQLPDLLESRRGSPLLEVPDCILKFVRDSNTPVYMTGGRHRHAGPASPCSSAMGSWTGRMNPYDDLAGPWPALDPDRCATLARAGIDTVKEVAWRSPVQTLVMLPLGAPRLVAGIPRDME